MQFYSQVCHLLQRVKEDVNSKPKSIESIAQLVDQQEKAVALLDEQRANVVSMIHRGKELTKESEQSPESVDELVTTLKNEWEEAYSKTVDNLSVLKGKP